MLDEAHALAVDGGAFIPPTIGPIPVDHTARRQFSFSRLNGQLRYDPPAFTAKPFEALAAANAPLDPRGFGSLVHDVLQRIDFSSAQVAEQITEWCEHLASQYVIHNADRAAREANKILTRFATSPRGRALASAKAIHREIEFLLPWPFTGAGVEVAAATEPPVSALGLP